MIYADTSFLFSLYAMDVNTAAAVRIYNADARRPLVFTPWQRFELRNAVRLAFHRYRRTDQTVPFNVGNVFKQIDDDLKTGVLRHQEPDWRETFRVAENISTDVTEETGAGGVDCWHVAAAVMLGADSFWTFDEEQAEMANCTKKFRSVRS
jgi:predicted nucleic acid-binding protein